jgi:EAL domain-containing protein (putative c-di-GMP-specific phosphodiesterase class I)
VGIGHESYRAILNQLSALGVNVALADSGAGNTFLDSFQRLPQYVMKIDRSFVRDATVDRDHAAIVEAVVSLARAMKLKVVAEGVETREQLDALRRYGCDMVQGYLFSKPVPIEDITRMLQENKRLA